jgi:hypothetical protein
VENEERDEADGAQSKASHANQAHDGPRDELAAECSTAWGEFRVSRTCATEARNRSRARGRIDRIGPGHRCCPPPAHRRSRQRRQAAFQPSCRHRPHCSQQHPGNAQLGRW